MKQNLAEFKRKFNAILASIPYHHYQHFDKIKDEETRMERYETHYASLLYMIFLANGLNVRCEEAVSGGRSDMVLLHAGQAFVFEFKMIDMEGDEEKDEKLKKAVSRKLDAAIAQIEERGYANKHWDGKKPVHLVGMVFNSRQRNLAGISSVNSEKA